MADPFPETMTLDVRLYLRRADPAEELTCLFCHGPKCEWDAVLRPGTGTTITVGVHDCCREKMGARK